MPSRKASAHQPATPDLPFAKSKWPLTLVGRTKVPHGRISAPVTLGKRWLRLSKGPGPMTHQQTAAPLTRQGSISALALATIAFAVNFWAWGLLTPLGPAYQEL